MNKISKTLILSAVLAIALLGTNAAFAQESIVTDQEVQTVQVVAIAATIIGACIAVAEGIANKPKGESVSMKKILSALITSIMAALVLVNLGAITEQTNGLTLIAIFITYFIVGYGTDKGLARLDK